MIDVRRDAIDLGGECDRSSSQVDQLAVIKRKSRAFFSLSLSMGQAN
jgi:hypothetical protein